MENYTVEFHYAPFLRVPRLKVDQTKTLGAVNKLELAVIIFLFL